MTGIAHRPFERSEIEQSIYARFAQQVTLFGDRLAIWTPEVQWTYAELSREVDAMAGALLRRVGDDEGRVALIFDHGPSMIAGILAAIRAGKAYVPLDPAYPEHRLQVMMQDSGVEAVLIEAQYRNLADRIGAAGLAIVTAEEARYDPAISFPSRGPRDIAYLLYTSGSTGRPKGVVQNHRNVLHFIRAYTNNLLLAPSDRLTLLSSYSFDAAVMGIYGGLLNGACVCPRSVKDGSFGELVEWIRRADITIYHSTPTVFRELLSAADPGDRFGRVRRVVLGGEAVVRRDVELFKRHFDRGTVLANGLGPTESTVTLQYFVDHDTELTGNLVPVGRPVCDTRIVLLDEDGRETDREGEMMFVSEHVALEYWRRPDLNAQAFGNFPAAAPLRCYRSGDLARRREDGNLEFLGRKDTQVKVNGVRIELGDIEAALEQQPGVAEAVVVGRTLPAVSDGRVRLVAYLRRSEAAAAAGDRHLAQIREGVRALLPGTMVPHIIVFVDAYPKTPTGKIDRIALPDPGPLQLDDAQRYGARAYVPPANEVERNLAKLWQEMLGIERVSVTDNFQSLGGDSLTALRLLLRMKTLGISAEVARGILRGKTIRELANPEEYSAGGSTGSARGESSPARTEFVDGGAAQAPENMLVNIVRGILLALIVVGHWSTPSLLKLPQDWAVFSGSAFAFFNVATPGFCFVFGLALGRIYYPIFKEAPRRARSMLFSGMVMLLIGTVLLSTVSLLVSTKPVDLLEVVFVFMMWPSGPLTYFAMALGTAPLWFWIISRARSEYLACAVLMAACWLCYQGANLLLETTPDDSVAAAILKLIFATKFNYFSMSMGALAGVATGIYLVDRVDPDLPRKSILFGTACMLGGLGLLYAGSGSFAPLFIYETESDVGIWRWMLYDGVVIIILGVTGWLLERYRTLPEGMQRAMELTAVLGQCTFPIYLLHLFVLEGKHILLALGMSRTPSSIVAVAAFFLVSAWLMQKFHDLHYGTETAQS